MRTIYLLALQWHDGRLDYFSTAFANLSQAVHTIRAIKNGIGWTNYAGQRLPRIVLSKMDLYL